MTNEHLSETEIQEYVLNKNTCSTSIIQHLQLCESCKIKAANYKLLFAEISQQPEPSFNFNLPDLVLQQLPQAKSNNLSGSFIIYFPAFIAVAAITFAGYFFRKNIENIFAGISVFFMYIIIIATFIIMIFKSIEMYKKYQQKINMLDFS
jgi:hypothetical protein